MKTIYNHFYITAQEKLKNIVNTSVLSIFAAAICFTAIGTTTLAQRCDPEEVRKILASDGQLGWTFGYSMAVSDDYLLVGAIEGYDDQNNSNLGAAYVYDRSTGNELWKFNALDGPNVTWFGKAVAISGTYAIVAADADGIVGGTGSVFVFDIITGAKIGELYASDGVRGDFFGSSIAVENTTLIVGAPSATGSADRTGAVYVFDLTTGTQLTKLTASNEVEDMRFGYSVAIHNNKALIGAYETTLGQTYMFDLTTYNEFGHLLIPDPDPVITYFSKAIALNDEYAVVSRDDDSSYGYTVAGSVYVFSVTTGNFINKLTPSDTFDFMHFGSSVSLDGSYLAVGAPGSSSKPESGKAYIYDLETNAELANIIASDHSGTHLFGSSLALNQDQLYVGDQNDDENGPVSGSVYEFDVYCSINPHLEIIPETLVSNQSTTFSCSNMKPNEATYLLYSLSGLGAVFIPQLNVVTDLKAPILGASKQSDALGNCTWTSLMPTVTHSYDVWFQALQFENLTLPVATEIIP